jgi:hypothetical protein
MFTWISIHREAIHRILEHQNNQTELLKILGEMEQQGLSGKWWQVGFHLMTVFRRSGPEFCRREWPWLLDCSAY